MIYCSDICVCIPVYKESIDDYEHASIMQCFKILKSYDKILIAPQSLSTATYENEFRFQNVIRFDDMYFNSTLQYSRLCLSNKLYQSFFRYKYMLIYQLDAYVFRDDLLTFANCNFDYIGAPWCHLCNSCSKNVMSTTYVGNGGLSLRNVKTFIEVTKKINPNIVNENEDLFLKKLNLKMPTCQLAMRFSVESNARMLIHICHQLPFGFHNLKKIDFPLYCALVKQ